MSVILIRIIRGLVSLILVVFVGVACYHAFWAYYFMLQADDAHRRIYGYKGLAVQVEADTKLWDGQAKLVETEFGIPTTEKDAAFGIDENLDNYRRIFGKDEKDLSIAGLTTEIQRAKTARDGMAGPWKEALLEWDVALDPLATTRPEVNLVMQLRTKWEAFDQRIKDKKTEMDEAEKQFVPTREGANSLTEQLRQAREAVSVAKAAVVAEERAHRPKPGPIIEATGRRERKHDDLKRKQEARLKPPFEACSEPDGKLIEVGSPRSHFARINLGWRHHLRPAMHFTVWRYDKLGKKKVMGRVEVTKIGAQTSECVLLPPLYRKPVCRICGWVARDAKMRNCVYCASTDRPDIGVNLDREPKEAMLVGKRKPLEQARPGDFLYNPLYLKKRLKYTFYIAEDTVLRSRTEISDYIRQHGDRVVSFHEPAYLRDDGTTNPVCALRDANGDPTDEPNIDGPGQPNWDVDYIVLGHGRQTERLRSDLAPRMGLKTITEEELYEYYGEPIVP